MRIFARGRAFDRDQVGERDASGDRPRRLADAKRDALRAACAVLGAAARSVKKRKHAVEHARAFVAMRGQQLAKIDAVVTTQRGADTARSYVSGNALKPPIGLPELRRAHGARDLAQAAFDLAGRTVEALEGELSDAEALAGKAQAAVVEAALGVLVVEAEKHAADCAPGGSRPGRRAAGSSIGELAGKPRRGDPLGPASVLFAPCQSENDRLGGPLGRYARLAMCRI